MPRCRRRRPTMFARVRPSSSSTSPRRSTSAFGRRSGARRDDQRARHDRRARGRARGTAARRLVNTSTGGGLYGDAERAADAGRLADPSAGALRAGQARGRGLLRALHAAARPLDGLAALRQRLRAAPGRARRGRRRRDLLRPSGRAAERRPSTATAARRATGSRSPTWCAPTCSRPSPT